ncbi:MAG: glucose 1-dehydrogenase [Planctomycetes bacterium]|nr:glucose 1-dehydrogenase [Planctomycetota bacterium]
MRALVITPGVADSARLEEIPEPSPEQGSVLVETLAVGVCGTDREILAGEYGAAPPGENHLVLGHESLGRVVSAPMSSGLLPGALVVGIVRRPDPVPCPNCAVGEWDMCRNGQYTEHGIKELHGFCRERFRIEPDRVIELDARLGGAGVLVEPASVVAKAWEHIERIGQRSRWTPQRVLVTGAGPIGLLAAMMGVQRGLEVHVLDRVTEGPKPDLVRDLGATYHIGVVAKACANADIVLECTGVAQLVFDVMQCTAHNGIVCLTGISSGGRKLEADIAALNRAMVLENDVVFGTVNANRRHYEAAATALCKADRRWLDRLISRRAPLESWQDALVHQPNDVKTVIELKANDDKQSAHFLSDSVSVRNPLPEAPGHTGG